MITSEDCRSLLKELASGQPRSRQRSIGPSEIGMPCSRRLGYRMLGTPKVNTDSDPLAAWIGTAVHAQIDRTLSPHADWATELKVKLPGTGIGGTLDAYHLPSKTVLDWKVVGDSTLRKVRTDGKPSDQYRVQVHTYAVGAIHTHDVEVENVAIAYIPRSGRLNSLHLWTEPFDPQIVEGALARLDTIQTAIDTAGEVVLDHLPTAEYFCTSCPWFLPGAPRPQEACGGHKDFGDKPGK